MTGTAFHLIVVKYKRQAELFDDRPRYHVIASNRVESAAATLTWSAGRERHFCAIHSSSGSYACKILG